MFKQLSFHAWCFLYGVKFLCKVSLGVGVMYLGIIAFQKYVALQDQLQQAWSFFQSFM